MTSGEAAQAATERLYDLGHRRAAMLTADATYRTEFGRPLEQALRAGGLSVEAHLTASDGEAPALIDRLLDRITHDPDAPTAVLATYRYATLLAEAAERADIAAPRAFSIVSLGESTVPRDRRARFSSLSVDTTALGRGAARVMLGWLEGAEPPVETALRVSRWTEGETTGPTGRT